MNFWEKMQSLDKRYLYVVLLVLCSATLFVKMSVPTNPDPSSVDLYEYLMDLDAERPLLIQSDWTNSTRGENMGHLENLLRIVMGRDIKFVIYSAADPIAPSVARNVIKNINIERSAQGFEPYVVGEDYLDLGFFANAEATNQSMAVDLRGTFSGRIPSPPAWWQTVRSVNDCSGMVVVSASQSIDIALQRLNDKVDIAAMVTGVVGPTILPYYQSGQCKGIAVGLKGVYDVEYMMEFGVNSPNSDNVVTVAVDGAGVIPPFRQIVENDQATTLARGASYYLALHVALVLLVSAVVLGNVGMVMSKRSRRARRGNR